MIDAHVHIVGNGLSGSGCKLKLKKFTHRLLAKHILKQLDLPPDHLHPELDILYVNKLIAMVQDSPFEKIVILAHDHTYDQGRALEEFSSIYVPNSYVLDLAKRHKEFLAAVSIHPGRSDALEELERCLSEGAVMMKVLPNCHNIDCNNPAYTEFWRRMAEAKLPLLAHTGGELSLPVYNKKFADPRTLELPLQCGVTVIAAHCATSSLPFTRNYLPEFKEMLSRHPNLYGDNSGMQTPYRSRHFPAMLKEPIASRVVNGSDLPIPISGYWAFLRRMISKESLTQAHSHKNLLKRDYQIKKAMGFSDDTFTRIDTLLRL